VQAGQSSHLANWIVIRIFDRDEASHVRSLQEALSMSILIDREQHLPNLLP
jgi:hypothetical protein